MTTHSLKGAQWEIVSDVAAPRLEKEIHSWMEAYCCKKQPVNHLPLLYNVSTFTGRVLAELQHIPFGKFFSYQALACRLGNSKASRAVGGACGRNPLPLIIPCHRVLGQGQRLGGFSCGLPVKECLLRHEGISIVRAHSDSQP